MENKKLTFQEIIDIVKAKITLRLFATGEDDDDNYDEDENESGILYSLPRHISEHPEYKAFNERRDFLYKTLREHPLRNATYSEKQANKEYMDLVEEQENYPYNWYFEVDLYLKLELGLGEVRTVAQKGGTDQGSEWYVVKHFVDHDVYVRVDGYYSSYEGVDFTYRNGDADFGYEVKPFQKTITLYEK